MPELMKCHRGLRIWLLLLLLVLVLPLASGAQVPAPVDIEADQLRFDQAAGRYVAKGNVRLTQQGLLLAGERLWWEPATGHAEVSGNVRFESAQERLEAEHLWLNLNDRVGFAREGHLQVRALEGKNVHIRGAYLERQGEGLYRVEKGRFTSCDGDDPSWEMGAAEVNLTVGGFARARHSVFYLKGLPVFYLPYLSLPVKRERESGFLTPRAGSSTRKGTELSLAWYQVIADNQDATFYLDVLTKLGVGTGLEYRYLIDEDNGGTFKGYHVTGFSDTNNQDAVIWRHAGLLAEDTRLTADIEWVSSKDYFEDFGESVGEYTKDTVISVVALNHRRQRLNATGQLKYTKELLTDNDSTLQQLPTLSLALIRQPIGASPVFTLLDVDYTHFWREQGVRGQRLSLRPAVAVVAPLLDVLELEGQAGYRQRLYWTEEHQEEFQAAGMPEATVRLSTRLARTYGAEAVDGARWRHSLEPELRFDVQQVFDADGLPQYDAIDQLTTSRRLSAGLINRLSRRQQSATGGSDTLDWLYLRLSQEYDLRGAAEEQGDPHWLPLRAQLQLQPHELLRLATDSRIRTADGTLERNALEAGLRDLRDNRFELGYRYRRADFEYLYGGLQISWLRPVYLHFQERYNLAAGKRLEHLLGLEYRHQCWGLFLDLRDREGERSFLLSFALGGVGRVAHFGGSLGGEAED